MTYQADDAFLPKPGDRSILVCPLCGAEVHETEWIESDGVVVGFMASDDIEEDAAQHWRTQHRLRYRLIRWLSKGWWPS